MYQVSMFSNAFKGQEYVGNGCFARVSSLGNGWVVKNAHRRDATLNYLEWCKRKQDAGEGMMGMPEIDFIVHTEEGYIVTMRQYTPQPERLSNSYVHMECEHIAELIAAFECYMADTFGEYNCANDVHGSNVMIGPRFMLILTDPSSRCYFSHAYVDSFNLH